MKIYVTPAKENEHVFTVSKGFYETFKTCLTTDRSTQYIYFDKKVNSFVATNSACMIVHKTPLKADFTNFPTYYTLIKTDKEYQLFPVEASKVEDNFPPWDKIIPDLKTYEKLKIKQKTLFQISGKLEKDSQFLCELILKLKQSINLNFLLKVLKHVNLVKIYISKEKNKPIYIQLEDYTYYMIALIWKE